jgi:probable HAF family extracellular repeat protein
VITINPPTLAGLTVPADVTGSMQASGTVTLTGPAPVGGMTVTLTSSASSTAFVPNSVQVPANATSATFQIGSTPVSSPTTVTITATLGSATFTGNLTVVPAEVKLLIFDHFRVEGGKDATGNVYLNGPAPSAGIVVTLSTSNATLTTPPATVTVPAGANSTTVTVQTKHVTAPVEVTITAKTGSGTASARLRLIAPPVYTLTDLGALPGMGGSVANGINASGTVVGSSGGSAFIYSGGVMNAITTPQGFSGAAAIAINASGQMAMNAYTTTSPYVTNAFFFDPNTNTSRNLGTLGGRNSWATAINDAGQVVGVANVPGSTGSLPTGHAFPWDPTTNIMQDLGTLGGPTSQAFGINASGQVAGVADYTANPSGYDQFRRAFRYDSSSHRMIDLGAVGGFSRALGINAEGQVVGWSDNFQDSRTPFLDDSNGMHDIGPCSATTGCEARAVNDFGKIVAHSNIGGQINRCGQWSILDDLVSTDTVPDLRFSQLSAINNTGQIVGTGYSNAFLLRPISTADAPLTATGGIAVSGVEGKSFTARVADFTDADASGGAACYRATTIDWGDGASSTGVIASSAGGGFNVTGIHAYPAIGTYTYRVTVRDVDGATATATGTATVVDAPLDPVGSSITAVPGTAFTGVVGGFVDESSFGMPADFTATVDWGDGSATSSGTVAANGKGGFDVIGTHTYAAKGFYTITISVRDVGGSTTTVNSTANAGIDQVAAFPVMSNKAYGGYLTAAYLQNLGTAPASVLIRYYDQNGQPVGGGDLRIGLPVNSNWTVRQDTGKGLPPGGAGSAIVFSTQPLAAFVNEFAPTSGSDGSSYTSIPMPGGSTTLYAPAIFNNAYGGYFTGIGLINLGSAPTDVTITYRKADGTTAKTQTLTGVPALAYRAIYQGDPAVGLPAGFAGTATIASAGQPLAAIVNEVGNGGFSSYTALATGTNQMVAPVAGCDSNRKVVARGDRILGDISHGCQRIAA